MSYDDEEDDWAESLSPLELSDGEDLDQDDNFSPESFERLPASADPSDHSYLRLTSVAPRAERPDEAGTELVALRGTALLFPGEAMPFRLGRRRAEELVRDKSIVLIVHVSRGVLRGTLAFIQSMTAPEEEEQEQERADAGDDVCDMLVVGLRRCDSFQLSESRSIVGVQTIVDEEPRLPTRLRHCLAFDDSLVVKNYDIYSLREQVESLLLQSPTWRHVFPIHAESCDEWSWKCGSLLCVGADQRELFFDLLGTTARLKFLRKLLMDEQTVRPIRCGACSTALASSDATFPISKLHYVNPAGVNHSLLTVRAVHGNSMLFVGAPSTEHSYFNGYAWQIAYCQLCRSHLGWRFTAQEDSLVPRQFFAFSRDNVK